MQNTRVILTRRPEYTATPDCFELFTESLSALEPDQIRVAVEYVSVDA